MRFRLVALVVSEIYLTENLAFESNDVFYEFIPEPNGELKHIAVSMKIDPQRVNDRVEKGEGEVKLNFVMDDTNNAYPILLNRLKSLESQLSISTKGALFRILWEGNTREYIPENSEEANLVAIRSINISKIPPFPDTRTNLTRQQLKVIVSRLETLSSIDVPLAFWREGMNDLRSNRFIQAFYNFFFIIEGYYANGKTSEKEVISEFSKSGDLKMIIRQILPSISANNLHGNSLRSLYSEMNCEMDLEGTIKFLFRIRGHLHHVSFKSPKQQGSPLNQDQFISVAILARSIAEPTLNLKAKEIANLIKPAHQ